MTHFLDSCVIRIWSAREDILGAGVLVESNLVLTCNHNIEKEIKKECNNSLGNNLKVDFPLLENNYKFSCNIEYQSTETDIALLRISRSDIPSEAYGTRIVDAFDIWGHKFRTIGFPPQINNGVWVEGILNGHGANNWIQLNCTESTGYPITFGFSGAPVWDEQFEAVVGIVVATSDDISIKTAYMIPASSILAENSGIKRSIIKAGSLDHLKERLQFYKIAQKAVADPSRFGPTIEYLENQVVSFGIKKVELSNNLHDNDSKFESNCKRVKKSNSKGFTVAGVRPQNIENYFKDRKRKISLIKNLFLNNHNRLILISGRAGIGKTALACKVLFEIEENLKNSEGINKIDIDGIGYLSEATDGISLEQIFSVCKNLIPWNSEAISAIWTNNNISREEKIKRLLKILRNGNYLFLVDNLEEKVDDQGEFIDTELKFFIEYCIKHFQNIRFLITSNIVIKFEQELLKNYRHIELTKGLPLADAIALLRDLDPDGYRGLKKASYTELKEIVRLTHGVPKALELVNGILFLDPFLSPSELSLQFYKRNDVLNYLVDKSYERLSADAKHIINALSVYNQPVPLDAIIFFVEQYTSNVDISYLVQLLNKASIVSIDRETKLIFLHPLDRDCAYGKLAAKGRLNRKYSLESLELQAALYFRSVKKPINKIRNIDDIKPYLDEYSHLVNAHEFDKAAELLDSIDYKCLHLWGYSERIISMWKLIENGIEKTVNKISCYNSLGRSYRSTSQFDNSLYYYKKALILSQDIKDKENIAANLSGLALATRAQGKIRKAISYFKNAYSRVKKIDKKERELFLLGSIATCYVDIGKFDKGIKLHLCALETSKKYNYLRSSGIITGQLGTTYHYLGDYDNAIDLHKDALRIARNNDDKRGQGIQLNKLAAVFRSACDYTKAIELYDDSLLITRQIHDLRSGSYCLIGLARCYLALGQLPLATQYCNDAINYKMPETLFIANSIIGIIRELEHSGDSKNHFFHSSNQTQKLLEHTKDFYIPRLYFVVSLLGQYANTQCDLKTATRVIREVKRNLRILVRTYKAKGLFSDVLQLLSYIRESVPFNIDFVWDVLESE